MTLLELITEVYRRTNENPLAPVYYTETQIIAALNAAQKTFSLFTLCLEKVANLSLPAGTVFLNASTTLTDWICPLRLEVADVKLDQSPIAEFASVNPLWTVTTGSTLRYSCLGHDLMAFQPPPATAVTVSSRYAYCPADMVMYGDSPAIPDEDHLSLVDYAVFRLRGKDGGKELSNELPRMKEFMAIVTKRARIVRARAMQLQYDNAPSERWLTLMEEQWLTSRKS